MSVRDLEYLMNWVPGIEGAIVKKGLQELSNEGKGKRGCNHIQSRIDANR